MGMFLLKDRVIVITGAAGLLGVQHAEAVASHGGTPILLDVNQMIDKQAAELNGKYKVNAASYVVDITNEKEVEQSACDVLERYGQIDALVNNAANNPKIDERDECASGRSKCYYCESSTRRLASHRYRKGEDSDYTVVA